MFIISIRSKLSLTIITIYHNTHIVAADPRLKREKERAANEKKEKEDAKKKAEEEKAETERIEREKLEAALAKEKAEQQSQKKDEKVSLIYMLSQLVNANVTF